MTHRKRLSAAAGVLALTVSLVVASAATARTGAAPKSTSQPTIEGNAQNPFVGDTLTAGTGTFTNNPTSYSYQWQRCDPVGDRKNCTNISGATDKSYKVVSADVNRKLHLIVTAKNADGSDSADSQATGVVSAAAAPKVNTRPSIKGDAAVGQTLTADEGDFTGATSFDYQWQQCDANGNSCSDINGATGKTYGVRSDDQGRTLRVQVTGKNKYGSTTSTSDRTATVTTGSPTPAPSPAPASCNGKTAQDASTLALPNRMLIDKFSFPVVTRNTNTFTGRVHIASTGGGCGVAGAKVWATAIPYNQVSVVQTTTDANGWATLNFTVKGGFPANPGRQQILAMLVRATQPGGSVLAGVSTRRTLNVHVNLRG